MYTSISTHSITYNIHIHILQRDIEEAVGKDRAVQEALLKQLTLDCHKLAEEMGARQG